MRTCLSIDPTSIDSRRNGDPCTSCVHFLIYEGLTQMGQGGSTELALAKSIDVSEDGQIYTFHLRDAVWGDGKPITASDFEYSWKKTLTPQFGAACPNLFYPIKNAEKAVNGTVSPSEVAIWAIDDKTLRVELEHPTPYFLSLVSFCNFFPIPQHLEKNNPLWEHDPVSLLTQSGPFQLVRWERHKEILLKKNPLYWDAKNIHLDAIHISIIPDGRTSLQMFLNGELDFLSTSTSPIPLEELANCSKRGVLRLGPVGGIVFFTFNLEKFPFQNVHIRKALSLAIDRKAITDHVTQLSEPPATQFVPPVLFHRQARPLFSPFDPHLAREYFKQGLTELGVDKEAISHALVLTFDGRDQYRVLAQAMQHQWKKILDLDATLCEVDEKSRIQKHMNRDYQVGLDRWIAQYDDPSNILDRFKYKTTMKNLPGFENPRYIHFLDEASSINDPVKRFELLEQAENILAEEMPIAPLFYYQQGILVNPEFTNVETSPVGNLLFKKIIPKLDFVQSRAKKE